jgi:hypothetical protein
MKITDKMIEDINNCILSTIDRKDNNIVVFVDKGLLKQKGYEVEETKSKLDKAMQVKDNTFDLLKNGYFETNNINDVETYITNLCNAYEQAIEELQQKPKIDDDLIDNIKLWIKANEKSASWNILDIQEAISYFSIILQKLGANK